MKLHYSQTMFVAKTSKTRVLLPYEITLLSNDKDNVIVAGHVLLPYEITLLSNTADTVLDKVIVLLPYEITLLSNLKPQINCAHYIAQGNSQSIIRKTFM